MLEQIDVLIVKRAAALDVRGGVMNVNGDHFVKIVYLMSLLLRVYP